MTEPRKLTDSFARKDFEPRKPSIVWDTERKGFGLKIFASGDAEWIVKFRVGTGRAAPSYQYKIGPPSLYSCVEARALADDFIVAGRRGEDYRDTLKAHSTQQQADVHTRIEALLITAWDAALLLNIDVTERHRRSRERQWKHISERYGDPLETRDLDTAKLAKIKDEMSDRPAAFNKFRNVLFTVFENEVYEERLQKNPLKRIKPYPVEFGDTILSAKGVTDFLKYFSDLSNFDSNRFNHARYVICLLKTGVRPTMLRTLLIADDSQGNFVDWNRKLMIFRTHKTSKKSTEKAAEIPISHDVFLKMLAARKSTPYSKFVFGSHDKRTHFKDLTLSEKRLQKFFRCHVDKQNFKIEGTEKLVLYSLRHTFGSTLVNKGVPLVHVSKMMLHNNITTTTRYIKDTFETRQAVAQKIDDIFV